MTPSSHPTIRRGRRRGWTYWLAIGGIAATAILVGSLLAVLLLQSPDQPPLAAEPSASSTPRAEDPTPSAALSPSPVTSPEPVPTPTLGPDTVARVITTDLVVRSAPEISESSVIHPVRLSEPTLLFVVDGPVVADGYNWYRVAPFEEFPSDIAPEPTPPRFGWVAGGSRDGEAWIAPWAGDCPDPTLDAIHLRPRLITLACFGGQTLTLEGTFEGCFVSDPAVVSPSWLASAGCRLVPFGWEPEGVFSGGLVFRYNGDVGVPHGAQAAIRVVGHFDDPAARTCIEYTQPGDEMTPPELVILACRAQFVVTEASPSRVP